jgi:hypothetical protein
MQGDSEMLDARLPEPEDEPGSPAQGGAGAASRRSASSGVGDSTESVPESQRVVVLDFMTLLKPGARKFDEADVATLRSVDLFVDRDGLQYIFEHLLDSNVKICVATASKTSFDEGGFKRVDFMLKRAGLKDYCDKIITYTPRKSLHATEERTNYECVLETYNKGLGLVLWYFVLEADYATYVGTNQGDASNPLTKVKDSGLQCSELYEALKSQEWIQ